MESQTTSTTNCVQHLADAISDDEEWAKWKMIDEGCPNHDERSVAWVRTQQIQGGKNMSYGTHQGDQVAGLSNNQRESLVECFAAAIRHARRVSRREHIKANRLESVDQFVVSLRRELLHNATYNLPAKELVQSLCNKAIWYDIGVLTPTWPYGTSISKSNLEPIVERAHVPSHSVTAQCDEILGDIEGLEGDIGNLKLHVQSAERIAEQGEQVIEELAEVFS